MKLNHLCFLFLFFLFSCSSETSSNERVSSGNIKQAIQTGNILPASSTGEVSFSGANSFGTGNEILILNKTPIVTPPSDLSSGEKKAEILKKMDLEDENILKYVDPKNPFHQLNYVPKNLSPLSGKYIVDSKKNQTLRPEALLGLQEMSKAFYEEFGTSLVVVSAYRSYEYQKGIKQRGCSDLLCAKAGHSEHQTGLAIDLFEATSQKEFLSKKDYAQYFEWLSKNAHTYGFHNSYQKGREIDGYAIEPWHWRYLGVDMATILFDQKITYAEYIKNQKK